MDIDIHTIPILSVCQPYAHLIIHGPKRIENRTWATKYRGWLGIHASKSTKYMLDAELHRKAIGDLSAMRFGAVIGVVRLVACAQILRPGMLVGVKIDATPQPDYSWVFGDPWWEGPIGWILESPTAIEPIVCRGRTGMFRI